MTFEEFWMKHKYGGDVPTTDEELKRWHIAKDAWEKVFKTTSPVWIVNKGQYSDMEIVAVKSNEEAARKLMEKCSSCLGTGKEPYFNEEPCWDCQEKNKSANQWNGPIILDLEDE